MVVCDRGQPNVNFPSICQPTRPDRVGGAWAYSLVFFRLIERLTIGAGDDHPQTFLTKALGELQSAIPPTNNGSEQALRPCVIFRKVTNCFRSEWAAKLYADIRSVIETARRKAIGALEAIRLTLNGLPLPAGPSPHPSG
jgi:transposase IS66 family protein